VTLEQVIDGAQEESGVQYNRVTTRDMCVRHVQRARKSLLSRCVNAWRNIEAGEALVVEIPTPQQGFGFNFGLVFGLGIGFATSANSELLGARLEIVLKAEAQRIDDDTWHEVNVGRIHDGAALRLPDMPMLAISDTEVWFVEPELWMMYDHVRLHAVLSYTDAAEGDALEPNAMVAPLFARFLVLDLAAWLAVRQREVPLAVQKRREANDVLRLLLAQCRSQSTVEVRR
jgi:hypothetical protein